MLKGIFPASGNLKRGPGALVLVAGPSGAGKDTLIRYAQRSLRSRPDIVFPRRIVTRSADPDFEDHESVSVDAFQSMLAAGELALHWAAHGLYYGVPGSVDEHVSRGAVVVLNVSRSVVGDAHGRYANVLTVSVSAPPSLLAARLAQRGREADIEERLTRAAPSSVEGDVIEIVNDGPIERGGEILVGALLKRLDGNSRSQRSPFPNPELFWP